MTTDTTGDRTRKAATDAAMAVFDRALKLMAPPRHVITEALDAAARVYAEAESAELDRLMAGVQFAGMDVDGHDVQIRLKHSSELLRGVVAAFDTLMTASGVRNYTENEVTIGGPPASEPRWVEQETTFTDPARMDTMEAGRPPEEWPPFRRYHVIVVKPGGKSPHALRQEAEQRAELAEARILAALALIDGGMPVGARNLRSVLTGDLTCSCEVADDGGVDYDPDCQIHGPAPISAAVMAELLGQAREATYWAMGAWVDVIEQAPGERTHYDGMLTNVIRAVLDRLDDPVEAAGR